MHTQTTVFLNEKGEVTGSCEEEIKPPTPHDGKIVWNDQQAAALEELVTFVIHATGAGEGVFYLLKGFAGTGKSTLMQAVAAKFPGLRIAWTAPTNKATKVLRGLLPEARRKDCRTIYSLLGLRLEATGEVKELVQSEKGDGIEDMDLVVVDEGSMINAMLKGLIEAAARRHGVPVIFMGDPAQLPPVKEVSSPIWGCELQSELTKVMRHDNQILELVTRIRQQVDHPFPKIDIRSNNAIGADGVAEGVWKMPGPEFFLALEGAAIKGLFHSGSHKAIAWRNITVDNLNRIIRKAYFGNTDLPYAPGDRVMALSPCMTKSKTTLMHTDDEAVVSRISLRPHPYFPQYETMALELQRDDDPEGKEKFGVWVCAPDSQKALQADLKALADEAKGGKRYKWKEFWTLKEAFHEIRHAYAITAHRAQGSTYDAAWVVYKDILINPNRQEAMRCLYVACSRPRKQLFCTDG